MGSLSKWSEFVKDSEFELLEEKMLNQIKVQCLINNYISYKILKYENYYYMKMQLYSNQFIDFIFSKDGILFCCSPCWCIDDRNFFLLNKCSNSIIHVKAFGAKFNVVNFFENVSMNVQRIVDSANLIKIFDCHSKYMMVYDYDCGQVVINNCVSCIVEDCGMLSIVSTVEYEGEIVNLSILLDMRGNLLDDVWDLTNSVGYSVQNRIGKDGQVIVKSGEIIHSIFQEVYDKLVASKTIKRIKDKK